MGKPVAEITPEVAEGLARVKAKAGSGAAVARLLGIHYTAVNRWIRVPIEHVAKIEAEYGVPRRVQRPDVFGDD